MLLRQVKIYVGLNNIRIKLNFCHFFVRKTTVVVTVAAAYRLYMVDIQSLYYKSK